MIDINVYTTDSKTGQPISGATVLLNAFDALDWGKPGVTINPNPRLTGSDGIINFYHGPEFPTGLMVAPTVWADGYKTSTQPPVAVTHQSMVVEVHLDPFV